MAHIPDDVLHLLAVHIDNVRELWGAIIRLSAYATLNRKPVSQELARSVLADTLPASG